MSPSLHSDDLPHPETGIILFTSGSLGEPKAVQLGRTGLLYLVDSLIEYFQLGRETQATITLPIFHTMALNTQFFPTFLAGGVCEFINTELSMGKLYRHISNSNGNFIALIGDMLKFCLEEKQKRNLTPAYNVQNIQLSGGITRQEHLEWASELFPNARIHKGFGLTECIRISMISSLSAKFCFKFCSKL